MTEQSSGQGRPDDWGRGGYVPGERGGYVPGEPYYGAGASGPGRPGHGAARPGPGMPGPGTVGPGAAGPGMPTTPIWQAAPGSGQAAPGAGQAAPGQGGFGPPGHEQATPSDGLPRVKPARDADSRGFLAALFDFSFTSFVTTRIIKVLYALITVLTCLTALIYTVIAFRVSAAFGFLTLIIGDPLFIIIVMAFWRLVLEAFVVVFRIAEDVRAMRDRGRGPQ